MFLAIPSGETGRRHRMKTRLLHLGMTVVSLAVLVQTLGAGLKW